MSNVCGTPATAKDETDAKNIAHWDNRKAARTQSTRSSLERQAEHAGARSRGAQLDSALAAAAGTEIQIGQTIATARLLREFLQSDGQEPHERQWQIQWEVFSTIDAEFNEVID